MPPSPMGATFTLDAPHDFNLISIIANLIVRNWGMPGRPPASYAYPRLWRHVEELGCHVSVAGIKRLRSWYQGPFPFGTQLSNRLIELKFDELRPALVDFAVANDTLYLINFHRERTNLPKLNPNNEIVRFEWRIVGWTQAHRQHGSEHFPVIDTYASAAGYCPEVIGDAISGRLLPEKTGTDIVKALASVGESQLQLVRVQPGRNATPPSGTAALGGIFQKLR